MRAAAQPDRTRRPGSRHALPRPLPTAPQLSRRALLGAAVAGSAGLVVGRVSGLTPPSAPPDPARIRRRPAATHRPPTRSSATIRLASHAAPGPPPSRRVRPAGRNHPVRSPGSVARLVRCGGMMTEGQPIRLPESLDGEAGRATRRHRRSPGSAGERSDHDDRPWTVALRARRGRPLRHRGAATGRAAAPPIVHRRRLGAGLERGRSGRAGLRRRPTGRRPRRPQPVADRGGRAAVRWSQMGFVGTSTRPAVQQTPRNLIGFKDGTNNILGANEAVVEQHVWLPDDEHPGLARGRHVPGRPQDRDPDRGLDRQPVAAQQAVIGRTKESGGPLSGGDEFTAPDFEARSTARTRSTGRPMCGWLTHRATTGPGSSVAATTTWMAPTPRVASSAGLLFISYQRSPDQFITIQRALAPDRPQPVHPACRVRALRGAARGFRGRVCRRDAVRLIARRSATWRPGRGGAAGDL